MCHALTTALQEFEGAVIVVSHDRHLLRNTVDELLLVDQGRVDAFDGSLDDYRLWLLARNKDAGERPQGSVAAAAPVDKKKARQDAAAKRAQLAPLRKEIKKLEKHMQQLQQQLGKLEETLADSELYSDANKNKLKTLLADQASLRSENDDAEERWLGLQEEMETLDTERNGA